ncbi:PAS domain S-box protein, partial [Thermodesulfobacteriota bacterium]
MGLTIPVPAESGTPVRVGVYQNAPLTFIEKDGSVKGFFTDLLEHIAEKEGWEIEYVPALFSECLRNLKNGDIDLLGVIAYTESRGKIYDYTFESVITNWGQLYVSRKSNIESIIDLEGKKVAVLQNDVYFDDLKRLVSQFGIQCRFVEAFEYRDVLKLIESGRCEAGLVTQFYGLQFEGDYDISKSSILISPQKLYWASPKRKNKELLYRLDKHLKEIKGNKPSVYHEATAQWFGLGVKSKFGRWLKWIIIGFVTLLILFSTAGLVLRAQVKSRTKELLIKNKELMKEIAFRKAAEEARRESEEKYRTVLDANPDPVVVYDVEGRVVYFNQAFERVLGWRLEERLGKKMDIFVPEDAWPETKIMIEKVLAGEIFSGIETKRYTKAGNIIPVSISGAVYTDQDNNPMGSVISLRDISKQKLLEGQLHQAQKMESLGTLAGGIAHDFNNLLMGIQGRTSLMLMDTASSHPYTVHLKGIEDYVKSAADLTRQLLGFARGGKYEVKPTDVNKIIAKQNQMFGRTRKEINILERFEKNLWTIDADRGQIEQVLLNIYVNAWQAMHGGGDLYIETGNIQVDDTFIRPYHVSPGEYVRISITDTGVGMDKETQQRIFDPFFTTKDVGRGSGLGLASAYGIIKNHDGFIDVYSEIDKGTTFNIYFPASKKKPVKENEFSSEVMKGTETILLVDDEDMILDVGREIIEKLGYEIMGVKGGKEAVALYEKNRDRIDLVILDMVMPEMGGG